ncbi:MAG: replication-associated recombination protein A [Rhodocyclaceae bacterium]|nr:replication-associated recombination protein A [Rhodocyclaceae bacterium]
MPPETNLDLFAPAAPAQPLAERLRPQDLEAFVGQKHLLGPGRPLRVAIETGTLHSLILWGPPGVGKTTLAHLLARACHAEFIALSAVFAGVKDIRDAVAHAQQVLARDARRTVLFVDEVHRFNKAQQDAFLPFVEQGLITIIGATTENPSFELNSALLSRTTVYVLEALGNDELARLLERARVAAFPEIAITEAARLRMLGHADGDARRVINLVELLGHAARSAGLGEVNPEFVERSIAQDLRRFDKGGEMFYDQISALHKSVRGSDPDAALYWLVRMLDGGADPLYLGRRLVRMAVEDIGLAVPQALDIALGACAVYERLGSPEGELALAEAAIFLACAEKSNAVYQAYKAVRGQIARDVSRPVPMHLRNAPTALMRGLGYGQGYRYAHDEADAYAAGERYLPEGVEAGPWYRPSARGFEARIADRLARLRIRDAASRSSEKDHGE